MSNDSIQSDDDSLFQVMKQLARKWRSFGEDANEPGPLTVDSMKKYMNLPIWALCRIIHKETRIPENDLKWVAWYSDTLPKFTPTKYPGEVFLTPNVSPELDDFLENCATGQVLDHLLMIHEDLKKCDDDGRTAIILNQLKAEHSGVLRAGSAKKPNAKANVNARMVDALSKHPEATGWTCYEWAKHLKCGASTIVGTSVWKSLSIDRAGERINRRKDRSRRRRHYGNDKD